MCFDFVSIFVASTTLSNVVVGYWYLGGVNTNLYGGLASSFGKVVLWKLQSKKNGREIFLIKVRKMIWGDFAALSAPRMECT